MDAQDRRILEILQRNADVTNAELAKQVHMSPSSCLRRVKRLEDRGVITRRVALVDPEKVGRGLTSIIHVVLDKHGRAHMQDFIRRLQDEPAVQHAYGVTGEADVVLILRLRDMKECARINERLFDNDPNVIRFHTHFAMQSYKDDIAVSLDAAVW